VNELEARVLELQAYVDRVVAECHDPATPRQRREDLLREMRALQRLLLAVQREMS